MNEHKFTKPEILQYCNRNIAFFQMLRQKIIFHNQFIFAVDNS